MKQVAVVGQILFLYVIYLLGQWITTTIDLPIPANVVGMLLLFFLLVSGTVKLSWIESGADLLLRHLNLFFIPTVVGVILWSETLIEQGLRLAVVIVVSTLSGLFAASWSFRSAVRRGVEHDDIS